MARIRYIVGRRAGKWYVTRGREVVYGPLRTQRQAIAEAAMTCRARWADGQLCELIIKGRDGRIRDSRTYGRDPRHIKG